MLTSANQRGDSERCRQLGISMHLIKPIRQLELLEALKHALRGYRVLDETLTPEAVAPNALRLPLLVAEDNLVNQKLVVAVLRKWGHSAHVVSNGRLAVDAVASERLDAILMDVQMPEMGGFEATAIIREAEKTSGQHIPIVAMTAHAMTGDREKCLSAGMDAYISKPISARELAAILESVVPQHKPSTDEDLFPVAALTVDRDAILERIGGDFELMKELADAFVATSAQLMDQINTAIEAGDRQAIQRAAHAYKGSASVFGLSSIVEVAQQMEQFSPEGDISKAKALASRLAEYTTQACTLIKALSQEMSCAS
jgi:two-component system, sensor histidine kinase and response regulator